MRRPSRTSFESRGARRVANARPVGATGGHLRLKLHDGRVTWDAMAFRQGTRVPDGEVDIVYTVGVDRWGGQEVFGLRVLDFRTPDQGVLV